MYNYRLKRLFGFHWQLGFAKDRWCCPSVLNGWKLLYTFGALDMVGVSSKTFRHVIGWVMFMTKLNNIHHVQTCGISVKLDCLFQSAQGASIFGGVQNATQLFEGSF
jgi:hypothetical protein